MHEHIGYKQDTPLELGLRFIVFDFVLKAPAGLPVCRKNRNKDSAPEELPPGMFALAVEADTGPPRFRGRLWLMPSAV